MVRGPAGSIVLPLRHQGHAHSSRGPGPAPGLTLRVDDRKATVTDAVLRRALRGQVIVVRRTPEKTVDAATGVRTPGVLDDLYADEAARAPLGVTFQGDRPTIAVWAPTAHQVTLELAVLPRGKPQAVRMRRDERSGVWRITGAPEWNRRFYRFRVTVFQPALGRMHTTSVVDPYAIVTSPDSAYGQIIDPSAPDLLPPGWSEVVDSGGLAQRRAQVHEVSVRDFSIADPTVPEDIRGTYLAFTFANSDSMAHLRRLASAGVTHVELLPVFEGSSMGGLSPCLLKGAWKLLTGFPPDSPQQQRLISALESPRYSWGYDPTFGMAVTGFYATDPAGPARILEFRRMVAALREAGLGTVLDVVYNHVPAAGVHPRSVLDQIVPGYYLRLLDDGQVATSTTGASTAPEHAMMGRLVVDSVVALTKTYKISGFRFDLMGHHPKANIVAVRQALDRLTIEHDGVRGKSVLLWGEGWNFGVEVADDVRFVQATQHHLAGTGIGTFNDRLRDAVRGGGPFDDNPRRQGFVSGLYTDPNGDPVNGTLAEQRATLLRYQDVIQIGLAGNLASYTFTDSSGQRVTGADVDWNGSPTGYTAHPGEAVTYVDSHDDLTLYDALVYKLPRRTSRANRVRVQVLALAITALSQGTGFVAAGSDRLRSKSLDANSYTSGDWFNALLPCERGNGFGRGLPPQDVNGHRWAYARPLLADPALVCDCAAMDASEERYEEFLRIATDSSLFHLGSAEQVQESVSFPLSGKRAEPGVIAMVIEDVTGGHRDPVHQSIVVIFNAARATRRVVLPSLSHRTFVLHPILAASADPVARTSTWEPGQGLFRIPPRTAGVFVEPGPGLVSPVAQPRAEGSNW